MTRTTLVGRRPHQSRGQRSSVAIEVLKDFASFRCQGLGPDASVPTFHFAPEGEDRGGHLAPLLKSGHREFYEPIRLPAAVPSNAPCVIDHWTLSQHPGHGEEIDL